MKTKTTETAPEPIQKLLTANEVAALLRVQEQTLRKWRLTEKKGPPWITLCDGRSIRYDDADVQQYLNSRKRTPTSAQ